MKGYTKTILRIDLTKEEFTHVTIPDNVIEHYVGGAGFGAYFLNHENPDEESWAGSENRIIFTNGPLSYTAIRGSGTINVTTKGPMTNLAVSTQANGYIGSWLKSCGYDGLIIQGKAARWSYLYIDEDKAEIRDATYLVGEDTQETQKLIKKELERKRGVSVYCVGPAAEKGVRFSVLMGDKTHTASKNGVGAVLAAKRVKAIVVCRGKVKIDVWDNDLLKNIARKLHNKAITYADGSRHKWGTNGAFSRNYSVGALPVKNYTTNLFPMHEKMSGQYVRSNFGKIRKCPCFNCGLNHITVRKVTEGPYAGFVGEEPEYEAFAALGPQIYQTDAGTVFVLNDLVDRLGMDVNEIGWVLGWLMECYEKGIITSKELDGIEMKWGNVESTIKIIHKIAKREGIGDLLAEGVKRAAQTIGGDATEMAVYTMKASTPRTHDHRARWSELLDSCFTNTSTLEATFVGARPHLLNMPPAQAPFSPWEVPLINAMQNGWAIMEDCMGACRFNITDPKLVVEAYNAVTNANRSLADLIECGKRIVNVLRIFNIRNGLTPNIEFPSQRYGSAPVDGPAKGISIIKHWELIRKIYYQTMGWDTHTGRPSSKTLQDLGLGDLV